MIRYCTQCGAKVGSPHHHHGEFIWRRKAKNLIEEKRTHEAMLMKMKEPKN